MFGTFLKDRIMSDMQGNLTTTMKLHWIIMGDIKTSQNCFEPFQFTYSGCYWSVFCFDWWM